jgi:hypothetical protein
MAVGLHPDTSIDKVHAAYGGAVGRGTIQRLQEGGRPRLESLQKMADAIGLDVSLLMPDAQSEGAFRQAHSVSLSPFDTASLTLEEVMRLDKLPPLFELAVPDGALGPGTPQGTEFVWSTTREPAPERLVIVRDSYGQAHVREYRRGAAPGQWTAAAVVPSYPSFDGADVTLLAVSKYRET